MFTITITWLDWSDQRHKNEIGCEDTLDGIMRFLALYGDQLQEVISCPTYNSRTNCPLNLPALFKNRLGRKLLRDWNESSLAYWYSIMSWPPIITE